MGCRIERLGWTRLLNTAAHEWRLLLARPCLAKRLVGWKHEAVAEQCRREQHADERASWWRRSRDPDERWVKTGEHVGAVYRTLCPRSFLSRVVLAG